jgi:Flp pilus assembly protein TadD
MKRFALLIILIFMVGCKNNAELTMERGIQYFEWNLVDKAILEFNQVIHMFPKDFRRLDYDQVQLLSQAHHNLSVAYAKKEWFVDAEKEARHAFELVPSTENRRVLGLIKEKL